MRESTRLNHLNDSKTFIVYLNNMDDIYKHIDNYNQNKKHKTLIVFNYMVADIFRNKKFGPIVNELLIRS